MSFRVGAYADDDAVLEAPAPTARYMMLDSSPQGFQNLEHTDGDANWEHMDEDAKLAAAKAKDFMFTRALHEMYRRAALRAQKRLLTINPDVRYKPPMILFHDGPGPYPDYENDEESEEEPWPQINEDSEEAQGHSTKPRPTCQPRCMKQPLKKKSRDTAATSATHAATTPTATDGTAAANEAADVIARNQARYSARNVMSAKAMKSE
jgi:hypothetical protein